MTHPIQTHSYLGRQTRPVVLSISGSDSAAMAGIQMDSRACEALGVHCATAITAATAQNNQELIAINPLSAEQLQQQVEAALALKPAAIKIGMLASAEQVSWLGQILPRLQLPVVYDPVIRTSSDADVMTQPLVEQIKRELLPHCTLLTPNLPEAKALTGLPVTSQAEIETAAKALQTMGSEWVVIKGGHSDNVSDNGALAQDYCLGPDHSFWLKQPKIDSFNLRGSGCALASTLASTIALGYEIRDGLIITKMAIQQAIEQGQPINGDKGCLKPKGFPLQHWPRYSDNTLDKFSDSLEFPSCVGGDQPDSLGLYPIVDNARWLERLLPQGVTTAQLRVKHLEGDALEAEIEHAINIGKQYSCRLFINDYWQLAIAKGAYGVHLGQEDLETADLEAIQRAGLRLGLSNHCHWEVARAKTVKPSYIACGPTFATTTKDMPWIPHQLEGLSYWTKALPDYPLVSIAGIDSHNIADIAATGVSGIAMITAITLAENPEQKTRELIQQIEAARR